MRERWTRDNWECGPVYTYYTHPWGGAFPLHRQASLRYMTVVSAFATRSITKLEDRISTDLAGTNRRDRCRYRGSRMVGDPYLPTGNWVFAYYSYVALRSILALAALGCRSISLDVALRHFFIDSCANARPRSSTVRHPNPPSYPWDRQASMLYCDTVRASAMSTSSLRGQNQSVRWIDIIQCLRTRYRCRLLTRTLCSDADRPLKEPHFSR